ncbi:MAG: DUF3108 domain-containing protein, partial [Granulosicoccaceae bacterium]
MAKPYRKRVSNIASLLAGLLLPLITSAAPVPDFTAHYQLQRGSSTVGTRTLSFTREGQHYTLDSVIKASGLAAFLSPDPIRETSRGIISDKQLLSSQYTRNNSNKPSRNMQLVFDHAQQQVQSRLPRPVTYTFKPVIRDLLNELLGFMYAATGSSVMQYSIANDSRPKYYKLENLGPETVKTRAGDYQAIRYKRTRIGKQDRHTFIWIAPALHNLPVKIENHKRGTTSSMS